MNIFLWIALGLGFATYYYYAKSKEMEEYLLEKDYYKDFHKYRGREDEEDK